ncbi:MAG: AmmeMemoRadiSam system radical SAM enzyme [archaeon]
MEKEALYYKKLKDKAVQCHLCPHICFLKSEERGKCRVRLNKDGKLISLSYGKPCSVALDPIEKKPFYHFLPGKKALSLGTAGCNLSCQHCQNFSISQCNPENIQTLNLDPEEIVDNAKKNKTRIISYTYTEPTIFYEYMLDIAKAAKKLRIKNTIVSNGFINEKPLKKLIPLIKGANIDLKGNSEFYKNICGARIEPVLETIKKLKEKVWLELTNLIISGYNDDVEEFKKTVNWIKENLGVDTPLHLSAFYPCYNLKVPATDPAILIKLRIIAMSNGLRYVYTGNINDIEGSTTYCPKCHKALIIRSGYRVSIKNFKGGKCSCGEKIPGVWK